MAYVPIANNEKDGNSPVLEPFLTKIVDNIDDHTHTPSIGDGGSINKYVHLQHQVSSGTNGGNSSATTWNIRTLNTEVTDIDSICSLASNKFTLAAGNYRILVSSVSQRAQITKLRLYNVTDSSIVMYGMSCYQSSDAGAIYAAPIFLSGYFTVGTSKELRIDHYTQINTTNGLGSASSLGAEIYADVELWKVG